MSRGSSVRAYRGSRHRRCFAADVARLDPGKGLASATESYARSKTYATSATPHPPPHEYDGIKYDRENRRRQRKALTLARAQMRREANRLARITASRCPP